MNSLLSETSDPISISVTLDATLASSISTLFRTRLSGLGYIDLGFDFVHHVADYKNYLIFDNEFDLFEDYIDLGFDFIHHVSFYNH